MSFPEGWPQSNTDRKKPCLGLEHVLELAAVYLKALVRPRWVDVFVA